jgi:hypothetical protein
MSEINDGMNSNDFRDSSADGEFKHAAIKENRKIFSLNQNEDSVSTVQQDRDFSIKHKNSEKLIQQKDPSMVMMVGGKVILSHQ